MIRSAMDHIEERVSCIKFVEKLNQTDFVRISSGNGCSSSLGKKGGQQNLSLKKVGCFSKLGTIVHELIHALGYSEYQSLKVTDLTRSNPTSTHAKSV
jgi:hypothetical protein